MIFFLGIIIVDKKCMFKICEHKRGSGFRYGICFGAVEGSLVAVACMIFLEGDFVSRTHLK